MKYLICYYSRAGHTKTVAEKLKELTNFDLYEIKPKNPYPSNYLAACFVAGKHYFTGAKIEIESQIPQLDEYDGIFIGYPIWCWHLPQVTHSFAELLKLEGKKVIPFCTYGSSGILSTEEELRKCCPGAEVLKGFGIAEKDVGKAEEPLKEWLKELHIIE